MLWPAKADAVPLDFEDLFDLDPLTTQYFLSDGVTFSNAVALTAGLSLNDFEFPPQSGSTVIFDDGGPMRLAFATPIISFSGFFTYSAGIVVEAFDSLDNSLGLMTSAFGSNLALSGDSGSLPNELLTLALAGMSSVVITGDPFGGSFTLDDVSFVTQPISPPTNVPEPGTLWLAGLGGLALAGWRRR